MAAETVGNLASDQRLLLDIRERLGAAFGDRLRGAALFGSHAREEAVGDSDLDLMVLLDGPVSLGSDLEAIVRALYPVQLSLSYPIHALPVAFESFEAGQFAIYRNAKREGIIL